MTHCLYVLAIKSFLLSCLKLIKRIQSKTCFQQYAMFVSRLSNSRDSFLDNGTKSMYPILDTNYTYLLIYVRIQLVIVIKDTFLHTFKFLRYGDTLLASKGEQLKCILFQRDFA